MIKSELNKLEAISIMYGSALAMQRQIERSIASQIGKDHIKPSYHALKQTMDLYDKLEFSDWLGNDKPFDVDESLFYKADQKN